MLHMHGCAWLVCHCSPHGSLLPCHASGQADPKQLCPSRFTKIPCMHSDICQLKRWHSSSLLQLNTL